MVEFLLACVLFSHDLRWGRKKGNREVHVLWFMEKEEKSFLFTAQDSGRGCFESELVHTV
jgi:hypothetical protein